MTAAPPQQVSSGRGRHGPWLQNRWLRVETRQDDGTISPVALAGAFRPVERASAHALVAGVRAGLHHCDYDLQPHEDALGRGRRLTLHAPPANGVAMQREVVLYDEHPFLVTRVGITNRGGDHLTLDALHAFTSGEGRARVRLGARPDEWRIYRNGWQSWSPTMSFGGAERDVQSAPPVLSPEAPQPDPGRFASDDVAVLFDPASGRAMLAGAVSARTFITQTLIDAPARALDARSLCDGITLPSGETLWSERFAVDLVGQPREQLDRYGDALGREMGARVPQEPPAGWCSWYYYFTQVTEDDIIRNLRFLEQHRRELPVDVVQIDDGYQADIGDWLTVNEKFPHGMSWLASEIRRAGYTPGLWLAPFLLSESSRTFAEHPDWVVRDESGSPALAIQNWNRRNYGVDGSHPDALAWLERLFREVCDGWGYDYVKIDFLYAAAIAGRRHDPGATRVAAYRQALEAVRAGTGDRRFVLGCGSLIAPSVGFFDGNRIGPDVAPFWRFMTREQREAPQPPPRRPDDALSTETAIRNMLQRWWMHGRLWANDPDCLLVREDRTKLTPDEVRSLATAIGVSGGMVLSSDNLDQLSSERLEIISMLLPALPHRGEPRDGMERDMPERCDVEVDRPHGRLRLVGLFNFDDGPRDLTLALPPGRWHTFELWGERYRGVAEGSLTFEQVGAHGCVVLALREERGTPMVVGTNAHIGMGAVDISDERYDPAARCLRLTLLPAGRRQRRVYIATAGEQPAAASVGGAPATLVVERDVCVVEVAVDAPCMLEVTFSGE